MDSRADSIVCPPVARSYQRNYPQLAQEAVLASIRTLCRRCWFSRRAARLFKPIFERAGKIGKECRWCKSTTMKE